MKNTTNTNTAIIETLKSLKSTDDSINAIILTAIAAVKQAEESAKKEAELTALAAVLNASTAELSALTAEQIAILSAVADGQKKAIFVAFKMAADLAAENQALKAPKSPKSAAKKAKTMTVKQAYACLQAYECLHYSYADDYVRLSALLSEPIRFLRCNLSKIATIEQVDNYESSFRAAYLSVEYIQKLAEFIGPRFVNDIDVVKDALEEAIKQANDGLLKLVP